MFLDLVSERDVFPYLGCYSGDNFGPWRKKSLKGTKKGPQFFKKGTKKGPQFFKKGTKKGPQELKMDTQIHGSAKSKSIICISMIEMSILFFCNSEFWKRDQIIGKGTFQTKKGPLLRVFWPKVPKRDQMPFKGPTCHHCYTPDFV